jgi:predicted PurR-regulated permease PerM
MTNLLSSRRLFLVMAGGILLYVLSPMLLPILAGGILAVQFQPLRVRLERRRVPPALSSLLLILGVTLVFLLPVSALLYSAAKTGLRELEQLKSMPRPDGGWVESLLATPFVGRLIETLGGVSSRADLLDSARQVLASLAGHAADFLGQLLARLPGAALDLGVVTVSGYFLLSEGDAFVTFVRRHSPFTEIQTEHLLRSLSGMCRSVVLASVASGLIQALIVALACLSVGVPKPHLVAFLVFLTCFLPVIGAAPVTFSLVLYGFLARSVSSGIVLLVVALVVIAVDNLVRPLVLRGATHLHPLLAFVAVLGGLQVFGFLGIFLGPLSAVLFLATLELARSERSRG